MAGHWVVVNGHLHEFYVSSRPSFYGPLVFQYDITEALLLLTTVTLVSQKLQHAKQCAVLC